MSVIVDLSYRSRSRHAPDVFRAPDLVALRERVTGEMQHPASSVRTEAGLTQTDRWRLYRARVANIALLDEYSSLPQPYGMIKVITTERFMRDNLFDKRIRQAVHARHEEQQPVVTIGQVSRLALSRGASQDPLRSAPFVKFPEHSVAPAVVLEEAIMCELIAEQVVINSLNSALNARQHVMPRLHSVPKPQTV